jgi:hypothetical protein
MRFSAQPAPVFKVHVLCTYLRERAFGAEAGNHTSEQNQWVSWCCRGGSNPGPLPYQFSATTRRPLFLNEVENRRTSGARVNVINIGSMP